MNDTPGWCSCTEQLLYGCSWWLRRKDEAKLDVKERGSLVKGWEVLRMCAQSETARVTPRDYPSCQTTACPQHRHAGPLLLTTFFGVRRAVFSNRHHEVRL